MIYADEKEIRITAKELDLPVMPKWCKMDGYSKREYMKTMIKDLKKDIPRVREHIFGAIKRSNIPGWNIQENGEKIVSDDE